MDKENESPQEKDDLLKGSSTTWSHLLIRPLQEHDRDQLQQLHEELFPVKYTKEFYDAAVKNKSTSGHSLYSRVIVKLPAENSGCCGSPLLNLYDPHHDMLLGGVESSCMEQLARDVDLDENVFQNINTAERMEISHCQHRDVVLSMIQKDEQDNIENGEIEEGLLVGNDPPIIACIIGGFFHAKHIKNEKLRCKLIRNTTKYSRMFYIMTLGTTESFRKLKLGTKLVKDCLDMVQQVPSCGVVYLHVITYNQAAIQFYETLGFYRIEEIQGKYSTVCLYVYVCSVT